MERIESLSPESKVIRFCMEAGFLRVVEVGQYFMTKDTGDFRQFRSVACREYTHRDDSASQPKRWIQGNMRIGPVLEDTTSFQHYKYGIEIRIWSVGQDNSVLGQNILWNEQIRDRFKSQQYRNSCKSTWRTSVTIDCEGFCSQIKGKSNTTKTPSIIPMNERKLIDIEPSAPSLTAYEVPKKVISLLRHNQTVQRVEDGTNQFWRSKNHLRKQFSQVQNWSDDRWIACLTAGGGSKRRYQYCSDNSGTNLYLRALQGHSGHNLIDLTLQDNVIIQRGIFHHINDIGCVFNFHSIIDNWYLEVRIRARDRQYSSCPLIQETKIKDPDYIDFSVPRRARYVHSARKRHQDAVCWVDNNLAFEKGLTFHQTRSNAIILQETFPAYCIPKVVRLKTGEVLYEKSYVSPRPPPKISLRHRGNDELGSTVEQQPVGS